MLGRVENIELRKELCEIFESIQSSGNKMATATKFIDFFIHDILDYTIINEGTKNFTKNISIFNVKDAVDEIMDIMADKVNMKDLNVSVQMVGFKNLQSNKDVS